MGKRSKRKGADFERTVVKMILAAFPGMTNKDCYRAPLSGGHPFGTPADLVLSDRLRKIFPFHVECKHSKEWKLEHVLDRSRLFAGWLGQLKSKVPRDAGIYPLLVMRGDRTDVFCSVEESTMVILRKDCIIPVSSPDLDAYIRVWIGTAGPSPWHVVRFREFLGLWSGARTRSN